MRPITLRSLAVLSALLLATPAGAQRRPRYGGTLRLELRDQAVSLEEASPWFSSVFETLVTLDDSGTPQPHLAVSWSHDATRKRWVFVPRSDVHLHSGVPWTPAPGSLTFADDRPIEDLLLELARPRNAIVVRPPDGPPLGTGPFRVAQWEKGRRLTLAAHDAHWAGRPFLDAVEIQFNRALRDQAVDFELNRADIVEIPLSEVRRYRGPQLALSTPSMLMALIASKPVPGLAASIDRTSIHSVLLQKQGEPAGALLPQSLSGIAFLFPTSRDLDAARAQAAGKPPVGFQYDRQDPLLRAIGERITLNASEAGITLRAANDTGAPLRLAVIRLSAANPRAALEDLAVTLKLPVPSTADAYAAERALLDSNLVVPLFHLPAAYRISTRLHGWRATEPWPFANAWLEEAGTRP